MPSYLSLSILLRLKGNHSFPDFMNYWEPNACEGILNEKVSFEWSGPVGNVHKLVILKLQLFRERLSEKMCTRQSRKVIWDMINTLFLTTVAVKTNFFTFLWHSQTYVRGLPCNSFKFLWRTGHSKLPTIPFGVVACTFSDNLSRNTCIQTHRSSLCKR